MGKVVRYTLAVKIPNNSLNLVFNSELSEPYPIQLV